MSEPRSGASSPEEPPEIHVERHGTVPPEAVRPPELQRNPLHQLRPEHLYKAVALLFLFAVLFHYLPSLIHVGLLIYASVILAIILNAVVQVLPGKRGWMTGLLGLLIIGGVGAVLWFGLPVLFGQIRDLVGKVPEFTVLLSNIESWIRANTGFNINLVGSEVRRFLQEAVTSTAGSGGSLLSRATSTLEILLIPLLILFGGLFAVGSPNDGLISPLLRTVPRTHRLAFRRIFQLLGDRLLAYVRGVMIAMLAVGVLSYVGYRIAGVPNALALGVIAGITEAVPLAGPWLAGTIAVTVGLLESPTTALYAGIVALVVQQIEGQLITPFAMSTAAEVHPFVTLFALVLFGTLFGFLGILLSIPLVMLFATVVEVLWIERAIDTDEDRIQPLVEP